MVDATPAPGAAVVAAAAVVADVVVAAAVDTFVAGAARAAAAESIAFAADRWPELNAAGPLVAIVAAVAAAAVIGYVAIRDDRCMHPRTRRLRARHRASLRPVRRATHRYCPVSADWAGHAAQFGGSCNTKNE